MGIYYIYTWILLYTISIILYIKKSVNFINWNKSDTTLNLYNYTNSKIKYIFVSIVLNFYMISFIRLNNIGSKHIKHNSFRIKNHLFLIK